MKLLMLVLLFIPVAGLAQSNEFGRVEHDTLYLNSGEKYWKGKEVRLGYGSNDAKGFEFITFNPWSLAGARPLESSWANLKMVVKGFKLDGTKRSGKKLYLVTKGGNPATYWIDIVSALYQKEVVSDIPITNLADQIKKLKDLKDNGALTEEQYNAALKKVIGT